MKRNIETERELKELMKAIFCQIRKPYDEHELWPRFVKLAGETTEITDLEIYFSEDPHMCALCRPILMAGAKVDRTFEKDWAYHRKIKTITFKHRPHILYSDISDVEGLRIELESLVKVRAIFERILARSEKRWKLLCGPITTGGTGNRIQNLDLFHQFIVAETKRGAQVFNQMPFERFFLEVSSDFPEAFTETQNPILDTVFLPMIKAGKFACVKMLPGWETSKGATQEYHAAKEAKILIEYVLPQEEREEEVVGEQLNK